MTLPVENKPNTLRIVDLLRPHWKSLALALVAVAVETVADLLDPWPSNRRTLYRHIQRLPLAEHEKKRTGDLIGRVTRDIEAIQTFITSALLGILTNVLTLLGIIGVMLYLNWRFTLISLAIAPVLFLVMYFFTRRIKSASRDVRKKQSELVSMVEEVLSSIRVVKAFTREEYEEERSSSKSGKCRGGHGCAEHQNEALAYRRNHRGDWNLPDAW